VVVADAKFCKNCGAPLLLIRDNISWRPMLAIFLSVIPGLGQLYKGQAARGLLWFIFVTVFLLYAPPIGVLLWMICAGNAAVSGAVPQTIVARSPQQRSHASSSAADQASTPGG